MGFRPQYLAPEVIREVSQGTIHQVVHGYQEGHQLLAESISLNRADADLVARLSDLSGALTSDDQFTCYLTGYPLPSRTFYALAKTWPDDASPRAGCVRTHTLLIPMDTWATSANPFGFSELFQQPLDLQDLGEFRRPVRLKDYSRKSTHCMSRDECVTEFVARFFGMGMRPIVWFDEPEAEQLLWQLLLGIWPSLRRQFAFCTLCLQPRTLEERPFDLMFAPIGFHSRFHRFARENLLERSTNNQISQYQKQSEPWCVQYADMIFREENASSRINKDFGELWSLLGENPTEIRKMFLLMDLRSRASGPKHSASAAIGLLDLLQTLAPEADQAAPTKSDAMCLALQCAKGILDSEEALTSYFWINERLCHRAFEKVSSESERELTDQVANCSRKSLRTSLGLAKTLFSSSISTARSPFAEGILQCLDSLATFRPEQLLALVEFPLTKAWHGTPKIELASGTA